MVSVRAVYQQGQLRLLEPVNLREGQEVQLHIVEADEIPLKELIADILVPSEGNVDKILDDEAIYQEFDRVLGGLRPLSEIIIEDRGE